MRFDSAAALLLVALLTGWAGGPTWAFLATGTGLGGRNAHSFLTGRRPANLGLPMAASTIELPEGLAKTIAQEGRCDPVKLGEIATVKYACYAIPAESDKKSTPSRPFSQASAQKMIVGDESMIEGWDKAIRTMKVGERAVVRIEDPNLAYGSAGIPSLVPPNTPIELDLEILDSQSVVTDQNVDFDNLASIANAAPTTAQGIADAFAAKQAQMNADGIVKKEGLEGMIDRFRNFYFFGFFEGETGQRPPWFLRPSITFPLAFLIVGAAFYASFVGGAISERGAQVTDDLDEIILSTTATSASTAGLSLALTALTAFDAAL